MERRVGGKQKVLLAVSEGTYNLLVQVSFSMSYWPVASLKNKTSSLFCRDRSGNGVHIGVYQRYLSISLKLT